MTSASAALTLIALMASCAGCHEALTKRLRAVEFRHEGALITLDEGGAASVVTAGGGDQASKSRRFEIEAVPGEIKTLIDVLSAIDARTTFVPADRRAIPESFNNLTVSDSAGTWKSFRLSESDQSRSHIADGIAREIRAIVLLEVVTAVRYALAAEELERAGDRKEAIRLNNLAIGTIVAWANSFGERYGFLYEPHTLQIEALAPFNLVVTVEAAATATKDIAQKADTDLLALKMQRASWQQLTKVLRLTVDQSRIKIAFSDEFIASNALPHPTDAEGEK